MCFPHCHYWFLVVGNWGNSLVARASEVSWIAALKIWAHCICMADGCNFQHIVPSTQHPWESCTGAVGWSPKDGHKLMRPLDHGFPEVLLNFPTYHKHGLHLAVQTSREWLIIISMNLYYSKWDLPRRPYSHVGLQPWNLFLDLN